MATAEGRQAVRDEVGDVDATSPLLSDEQIDRALAKEDDDVRGAAALCLESLSRRFALQADVATGDLRLTYSRQSDALAKRAAEIRSTLPGAAGAPFAGGISRVDKEARAGNGDRVQPNFRRQQFDRAGFDRLAD